jgi:tripartite-type tricarboxylate transporter receptor subunit TctC
LNTVLGAAAIGTVGYMCAELFKTVAGLNVAIIPYKRTAPVMTDRNGGRIPIALGVLPPALRNIASGNLRAVEVTSKNGSRCCRMYQISMNPFRPASKPCSIIVC